MPTTTPAGVALQSGQTLINDSWCRNSLGRVRQANLSTAGKGPLSIIRPSTLYMSSNWDDSSCVSIAGGGGSTTWRRSVLSASSGSEAGTTKKKVCEKAIYYTFFFLQFSHNVYSLCTLPPPLFFGGGRWLHSLDDFVKASERFFFLFFFVCGLRSFLVALCVGLAL